MYCTCATSLSFIFDWLYPMTDVSSGDGKGDIFSVLLALLCGVNNFVQENFLF